MKHVPRTNTPPICIRIIVPTDPNLYLPLNISVLSTTCSPSPLAEGPSWWAQKREQQIGSSFSPWAPLRPGLAQKHPCLWILRSLTPSGKERSLAKITVTTLQDPPTTEWSHSRALVLSLSLSRSVSLSDFCSQEMKNSCPLCCSSCWIYSAFAPVLPFSPLSHN